MSMRKLINLVVTLCLIFGGIGILTKYITRNNNVDQYIYLKEKAIGKYIGDPSLINDNSKLKLPQGNIIINNKTVMQNIKGNRAIYDQTMKIISNCTTDLEKAKAIYVWIAENITYNSKEAAYVSEGKTLAGYGGAIDTFKTRSGVCLDYASLYFVMAKDAGLDVRMIGGQGLGGNPNSPSWAGHEWNQVYIPSLGKWVNVDCTFANSYVAEVKRIGEPVIYKGLLSEQPSYKVVKDINNNEISIIKISTADYFNTSNFDKTHKDGVVTAQWGTPKES